MMNYMVKLGFFNYSQTLCEFFFDLGLPEYGFLFAENLVKNESLVNNSIFYQIQ